MSYLIRCTRLDVRVSSALWQRHRPKQAGAARAGGGGDAGGDVVHPGGGEEGEGEAFFGPGGDDAGVRREGVVGFDGDGGQGAAQAVHQGAVVRPASPRDHPVGEAGEEDV